MVYQATTFSKNESSRCSDDFALKIGKQIKNQLNIAIARAPPQIFHFTSSSAGSLSAGHNNRFTSSRNFFLRKKLPFQDDKPIENVTCFIFSENNNYATNNTASAMIKFCFL